MSRRPQVRDVELTTGYVSLVFRKNVQTGDRNLRFMGIYVGFEAVTLDEITKDSQ